MTLLIEQITELPLGMWTQVSVLWGELRCSPVSECLKPAVGSLVLRISQDYKDFLVRMADPKDE